MILFDEIWSFGDLMAKRNSRQIMKTPKPTKNLKPKLEIEMFNNSFVNNYCFTTTN
jgi:hypothetical protein